MINIKTNEQKTMTIKSIPSFSNYMADDNGNIYKAVTNNNSTTLSILQKKVGLNGYINYNLIDDNGQRLTI